MAKFDFANPDATIEESTQKFDFSNPEGKKEQKPEGKKTIPGETFIKEYASGIGEIGNLVRGYGKIREKIPYNVPGLPPRLPQGFLPQTSEEIAHKLGVKPENERNLRERYESSMAKFSSIEAQAGGVVGGAGGPAGAGTGALIGTIHGALSGIVYQTAKELGADEDVALLFTFMAPQALARLVPKLWKKITNISPELAEEAIKKPPGGGGPPPPGSGINQILAQQPGETLHETAQRAIDTVKGMNPLDLVHKAQSGKTPLPIPQLGQGASLQGRIGPQTLEQPLGTSRVPTFNQEAPSLQGRVGPQPQTLQPGINVAPQGATAESPSLKGRGTEPIKAETPPSTIEKPLGTSEVKITKSEPLETLRAVKITKEPTLGEHFSKEPFVSDAAGGRHAENNVKHIAEEERKPIRKAYEEARKETEAIVDKVPSENPLLKYNDKLIEDLSKVEKRNAGQQVVLDNANAIRNIIGSANNEVAFNLSRLVAQADSISQVAKYEFPYTGYKDLLKGLVSETNKTVIDLVKRNKGNAEAIIKADKMYGEWAHKFLNDEISPFLTKDIRNPEGLYGKMIKDPGTYRAVEDAIGSKNKDFMDALDRAIIEDRMAKFYKAPKTIGTEEFDRALKNLKEIVGEEKTNKAFKELNRQKENFERANKVKEAAKEGKGREIKGRVTQHTREVPGVPKQVPRPSNVPEHKGAFSGKGKELPSIAPERVKYKTPTEKPVPKIPQTGKPPEPISKERITSKTGHKEVPKPKGPLEKAAPIRGERITDATVNKAASIMKLEGSDIIKKLGSPEGRKALKEALPKTLFQELSEANIAKRLREGKIEKNVTAERFNEFLNIEEEFQLFAETYGKEEATALRKITGEAVKKNAKKAFNEDLIKTLVKTSAELAFPATKALKILKVLFKVAHK